MSNNKIVLDLETQKTFAEVGSFQSNHHLLGISFVGIYSYSQQKYFGFFEKDLPTLEKILIQTKPKIIGFNTKGFDNVVLKAYFKNLNIDDLPQLDILEEVHNELGFRIKLESAAQATLGEGKSGTGLDAIRYYREKDFDSLSKYCLDDVKVTKNVYEFGRRHGVLYYFSGGAKIPIKISWGDSLTVREMLKQAFKEHKRLEIKYFFTDEKNVKKEEIETTIDIINIKDDKIIAYCHTKGKKQEFLVPQILKSSFTGENYAHQKSLI